jgi:hypothetical protein
VIGKRWDHTEKKEISLTIKVITPTLRIVVDPDVNGSALAATLTRRLKECVASSIRESVNELLEYQDNGLIFECTREEVLLSKSEYWARHKANVQIKELKTQKERRPGSAKGQISIAPDFEELPADFKEYV